MTILADLVRANFLVIFATGCAVSSDPEPRAGEAGESAVPIRMAPAKATAAQFLSTYKALCLNNFPQQKDMRATAQKLGFRKTDHAKTGVVGEPVDLEFHQSRTLKLSAQFGDSSLFWDGIDGGGIVAIKVCKVSGHVTDPQNLSAEAVRAALQPEISFPASESDQRNLRGTLTKHNAKALFHLPYLFQVAAGSPVIGADRCGALTDCRIWREVEIEITLRVSP